MRGDLRSIPETRRVSPRGFLRMVHSQTVIEVHPISASRFFAAASRRRLAVNLSRQKASCALGILGLQRGHWCQKQPFTKTANCAARNTKSGEPGNDRRFRSYPAMPYAFRASSSRSSVRVRPWLELIEFRTLIDEAGGLLGDLVLVCDAIVWP